MISMCIHLICELLFPSTIDEDQNNKRKLLDQQGKRISNYSSSKLLFTSSDEKTPLLSTPFDSAKFITKVCMKKL